MRIGVDARELCGRATGVGRYLAGLLAEWARDGSAREHEFVLYAPASVPMTLDTRRFATRLVAGRPGTWWEQVRAPRVAAGDTLDAWFAPGYTAPLSFDTPVVVAVHDLSFFARPEWFRVREGIRRRWLTRRSVAAARAVVTISDFSRQELIERLAVPAEKIHVIRPGVSTGGPALGGRSFGSLVSPGPQPPLPSPRVLYVGSLFTRRHVPDLVRAFAPIARAHPDAVLDIVGDDRTYPREDIRRTIAVEQLDGRVHWHEYLAEDRVRHLYAAARAFAFLSEYEGLGLTPLEALADGVPPVLLDTPIARESCGEAALYVPIGDRAAITRALEQALFDRAVRERILRAAPGVLARHDWPRAADATLRVIERCCR